MFDYLMQIVAPHYCYGCGNVGSLLCDNCKYDITVDPYSGCVSCNLPTADGICTTCQDQYTKAWCVADRSGALEKLINAYKFERARSAASDIVALLDNTLPQLPEATTIVPVPTIASHIRQRGYDHTRLVARGLARTRQLETRQLLLRKTSTVQRGSSAKVRQQNASTAFTCKATSLNASIPYLLVDDVMTTGATVHYAAKALREAGAGIVWVAVVARQPLDK